MEVYFRKIEKTLLILERNNIVEFFTIQEKETVEIITFKKIVNFETISNNFFVNTLLEETKNILNKKLSFKNV